MEKPTPLDTQELVINLHPKTFNRKYGFSLDIGGSLIKVARATPGGEVSSIIFTFDLYPISALDPVLAWLRDECLPHMDITRCVITCGIGCHQRIDIIQNSLSVNATNMFEFECFARGFIFLRENVPHADLVLPPITVARADAERLREQFKSGQHQLKENGIVADGSDGSNGPISTNPGCSFSPMINQNEAMTSDRERVFLVLIGSSAGVSEIHDDGSFTSLEGTSFAGSTFIGLGSLLTGCKSYDELVALAEQGRADHLDLNGSHLTTGPTPDMYSGLPNDLAIFLFGQAAWKNKDDFSAADLAAALLLSMCYELAQFMHLSTLSQQPSVLYLCGGFPVRSSVVRTELERQIGKRTTMHRHGATTKYNVVRSGVYLGALGALLMYLKEN